ncbi:receptor-type tyrosine-protein phosphatase T-like [Saccostrea echinata]|uniref:receptor-type tyrosine-protein phosphatase T-like n=1 Tax=Saccostrea echinata TaxID=191078 RepID=UPI002A80D9DA|nr:receptor-type tyrosine-protein phosphatase T-like [Saccostrea echinata]
MYANANAALESKNKEHKIDNSNDKLNTEALMNDGREGIWIDGATDDLYMNQPNQSAIPVNQLGAAIAEKRKNEYEGFRKEYATFPSGEVHKCDAGKLKENVTKNRFKTTFPYDHSRVILRSSGKNADYINANYIDGPTRKKEYIAAQGPKENTLEDFWSMIWQENISNIVMLTNLREGEKIKCTQYWPDSGKDVSYGVVLVKWMEEREYAFYVIRKLKVMNKEMNESRILTQYHYTAWPDHGTPEPLCLIIFHNHVIRTKTNSNNAPMVVHCSAGVGRTGTYIALDTLHQIGRNTGKINVADCVRKMRENRMTMVQTYEQYITIFLTLHEDFKAPMKVDMIDDFKENYKNAGKDTPANQNTLRKEFQLLQKIRPNYTEEDYKFAKESCGPDNRNGILPLDKYSIHLSSHVPKRGNYINAISMPSFTKAGGFIVTRYPSEEDAIDLIRLLKDHECETVICMDPLKEIQSSYVWLPSALSSNSVSPFKVNCQSCSHTDVTSSTIRIIRNNKESEAHTVRIVEPKSRIKSSGRQLDTSQLRNLVSTALHTDTENPVVVMSRDGASLCGVFCAVYSLIQQIIIDECVDVFTSVRQILTRRPEFCTNFEEYELIYKAAYDHIQSISENIYYNQ